MEWSVARVVRLLVLGVVGVGVYALLERWGMGWLLFAVGLGAALILIGLSAWHQRRAERRYRDIQDRLDPDREDDESL